MLGVPVMPRWEPEVFLQFYAPWHDFMEMPYRSEGIDRESAIPIARAER
jgi:hypothetical protein